MGLASTTTSFCSCLGYNKITKSKDKILYFFTVTEYIFLFSKFTWVQNMLKESLELTQVVMEVEKIGCSSIFSETSAQILWLWFGDSSLKEKIKIIECFKTRLLQFKIISLHLIMFYFRLIFHLPFSFKIVTISYLLLIVKFYSVYDLIGHQPILIVNVRSY